MDPRKIRRLVERYGIRELDVEEEPYYDYRPFDRYSSPSGSIEYNNYIREMRRKNVKLKMPLEQFEKLVNLAEEFDDLLHDRETRELINQARFINRLKYGTTF